MNRFTAAIASVVALACPEAFGREAAPVPARHGEVAVAIVPAEGKRAPSEAVVARLEVMLSNELGIGLVERALVRKVLAEQELTASGLTDPATAVRIGRLVAADLFLFVEKLPKVKPPACLHHHGVLAITAELGDVVRDPAVQPKETVFHKDHHSGRRGRLGDRR